MDSEHFADPGCLATRQDSNNTQTQPEAYASINSVCATSAGRGLSSDSSNEPAKRSSGCARNRREPSQETTLGASDRTQSHRPSTCTAFRTVHFRTHL
jgi:hypothetical protein